MRRVSPMGTVAAATVLFSAVPVLANIGSLPSIQGTVATTLNVAAQTSDARPASTSVIRPGVRAPIRNPALVRPFGVPVREDLGFFERMFFRFPFVPFFFDDDPFFGFGFEDD